MQILVTFWVAICIDPMLYVTTSISEGLSTPLWNLTHLHFQIRNVIEASIEVD